MPKAINTEIMAILRQFEVAGELSSKRSITQVKDQRPHDGRRILSFLFEKTKYFIVIDNSLEDDDLAVEEVIRHQEPAVVGGLIANPNDPINKGLRFKWKDTYLYRVSAARQRVDLEIAGRYPTLSRSTIQKHIKAGRVSVNGTELSSSKQLVGPYDDIALIEPEKIDHSARNMTILYIDDDVIVVDKPSGVLTHSKGTLDSEFTVAEFFRRYTTNGLQTNRPGIVHRLDRDTSGVMIGARTDEAALMLKRQFADRKVKKEYVAVVDGVPKVHEAMIDLPIGRNPAKPSTFRVDPSGKLAQTHYEVLATAQNRSLVRLWPKSGRTHQLRVHLEYLNTPIVGDRVYGRSTADRLYLHARSLEIVTPSSRRMVFASPLPKEFTVGFSGVTDVV